MQSLFKSSLLGLVLIAGVAATAHTQSVSALLPTAPAATPRTPTPSPSSTKILPNPGSNSVWQEEHSQPVASPKLSPDPGGSAKWEHHYTATDADKVPSRHPYTAGMGPKPN
jgi:hypothetical protein